MSDRYALGNPLGAGGLGAVFEARDEQLGRAVAVKLLRQGRSVDAPQTQRLVREANAMARISHPNVVQVFDVGRYRDLAVDALTLPDVTAQGIFVVMELVPGQDLAAWLARPREQSEILHLFRHAALGLHAAHAEGIVHRDFKPANVLVTHDGVAKVTDFGLAAAGELVGTGHDSSGVGAADSSPEVSNNAWLVGSLTRTGITMGTPAYMAPEQHRGRPVDARADQYAYCLALAEALYGHRPVGGDTMEELLRNKMQLRLPPNRTIPRRLRSAIERGMSPDPEARFDSMVDVLAAMDRRWSRPAAAAAVGALALVGGVAFASPNADTTKLVAQPAVETSKDPPTSPPAQDSAPTPRSRNANGVAFLDRRPDLSDPALQRQTILRTMEWLRDPQHFKDPSRSHRLHQMRDQAAALGDTTLIVESELFFASYQRSHADKVAAKAIAEAAYHLAEDDGLHAVAARAASTCLGMERDDSDPWHRWMRLTELHIELAGGDTIAELALHQTKAFFAYNQERFEDALEHFTRAVELLERRHGARHLSVGMTLQSVAECQAALGELTPAADSFRRAIAVMQEQVRRDEGQIAQLHADLGFVLYRADEFTAAGHEFDEALRLLDAAPPDDEFIRGTKSQTLWMVARLDQRLGQHAKALEHLSRIIPLLDKDRPENSLSVYRLIADSNLELGQREQAIEALRAGLEFVDADAPEWDARIEARQRLAKLEAESR